MIEHAKKEDPNECCGILVGTENIVTEIHEIINDAKSPYRYVMNPQQQLDVLLDCDKNNLDMLAFYHSHTHSKAYPSDTDVRMAVESGWLEINYILISLENKTNPKVKSYLINENSEISEDPMEQSD
jgi:proteasome lid subunit RPN8/RPN11